MIEVLKQALDALETEVSIDWTNNDEFNASAEKMHDAITSLRQAIAELESQEPVALESFIKWDEDIEPVGEVVGFIEDSNYIMVKVHDEKQISLNDELYIHPPQRTWVGLTDEEVNNAIKEKNISPLFTYRMIARAIEAKLKEKNT